MKNVWKTTVIALAALLVTAGMTGLPQNDCRTGRTAIVAAAEESASEYTVNIKLMQFHSEEVSMGNASMMPEAHIVVAPDGTAQLQIDMVSMTYLNKEGYLGWMKKVTEIVKENKYHFPTEIETVDAEILEEYTDVYDSFNDPASEYVDANVEGKWYAKKLGIPLNFSEKEDEILVQVYVPVMESIMEGGGTKFAVIDIDWDSLKQIAGESQTTTEPAQTTTETSQTTTTTAETTTTETTTTTATTTEPAAPSAFDKDNLSDGKYELQAEMIKADRSGYSMSNNGINHTVQLEVKDGEYFVTMQFKGLAMYNQFGYLKDLYYYNKGYTYNQFGKPMGDVTKAEVVSRYDVVDQYNDANNLYPQLVRFPLVEKANDEFVPLQVFVPIMEAIADGTGTQSVLMKLDWSTLTKTEEPFQIEEQEEQSKAFDYTDYATGVKLHADQGVLPNDASATVSAVTSGADFDTAKSNLSNFKVYSVSVSSDLNGKMQISLPIPINVTDPLVYRIADGKKTKINGTAENGMFAFSVKETGTFAIGSKPDGTTSNKNSGNSSKTSSPQTGDAGVGTVAAGLTVAAAAAFTSRRKRK
jgi:LPXTG-motif cell wall-anchored protein